MMAQLVLTLNTMFVGASQPQAGGDIRRAVDIVSAAKYGRRRFFFVGNGASASIASHMAADFLKTGGMKAQCFNDGALLTCLANDLGYEHCFDVPLGIHAQTGDLLFAISSSGVSRNIINAAQSANALGLVVITLSGFAPDNPLRKLGAVNFYVPSDRYGVVEVVHHAICHAILDEVVAFHVALSPSSWSAKRI